MILTGMTELDGNKWHVVPWQPMPKRYPKNCKEKMQYDWCVKRGIDWQPGFTTFELSQRHAAKVFAEARKARRVH